MPDDLYRPPTCPIYVDRLIADTMDLTDEEFGVYMRLMLGRQWPKGSIPADPADQARLTHNQTPAKMKKFASVIGERFQPHPSVPNAVHSPFMERVRETMQQRNQRSSDNGKKGAAKRWQRDSGPDSKTDGKAIAKPSQPDEFQSPVPRSDPSATPRDSARTREAAKKSPAFAFCEWMLDEGLKAGAINAHHGGDRFAWCYPNWPDAEKLFEHYDEAEIRVRAQRLIAMKAARKLRRDVTPAMLLEAWGWDQISGKFDLTSGSSMTDVEGL